MSEIKNHINKVYTVNKSSSLFQDISKVLCVLLPHSISIAGFNDKGQLLMIDYFENSDDQIWQTDFYNGRFSNKSMESLLKNTTHVFIDVNKGTTIPKSLHSETDSEKWLRKLYFIENGETINHAQLKDRVYYTYSYNNEIKELIANYLPKAKLLPLPSYQFSNNIKEQNFLQCCIAEHKVYASLYKNKSLVWQQSFNYDTIEDIAYTLKNACIENDVDENSISLNCSASDPGKANEILDIQRYFKDKEPANYENDNAEWQSVIGLFQQLYSCVS